MGSMRREGCYDRRYLPHHTEPSRSGLLVSRLAGQLKCRIRYLVSDCSKLLRRPGPLRTGPSIEKPSLRAGFKQGPSATRESGSRPWPSSLAVQTCCKSSSSVQVTRSPRAAPPPDAHLLSIGPVSSRAGSMMVPERAVFSSVTREGGKKMMSIPLLHLVALGGLTKATDGTHATRVSSASYCGS